MTSFKKLMQDLNKVTTAYLKEVNTLGNECAYTDRLVEETIDISKKLEELYRKNFEK